MSKHRNTRNAKRIVKSGILSKEAVLIRKTRCFKQVSAVIGPEAAMHELLRVVRECNAYLMRPCLRPTSCLSGCFVWACSPQGRSFWEDIYYSPKCPRY